MSNHDQSDAWNVSSLLALAFRDKGQVINSPLTDHIQAEALRYLSGHARPYTERLGVLCNIAAVADNPHDRDRVHDLVEAARRTSSDYSDTSFLEGILPHHSVLPQTGTAVAELAFIFMQADFRRDIEFVLHRFASLQTHMTAGNVSLVIAALDLIYDHLTVTGRACAIRVGASFESYDVAKQWLSRDVGRAEATSNALFVAAGLNLTSRIQDVCLERQLLTRFVPEHQDHTVGSMIAGALCPDDIAVRRQRTGADRAIRVFLGYFGQMRDPSRVLPLTVKTLGDDFATSANGPFLLFHGVSTWDVSGHRALSLNDGPNFYDQLLPDFAHGLITGLKQDNGGDLSRLVPNLVATCLSYSNDEMAHRITDRSVADLMPEGCSVVIADGEAIEDELKAAYGARFPDVSRETMNQFKMWSRIADLKIALERTEEQAGVAMDVCIFLRSDLHYIRGILPELACRAFSPSGSGLAFMDHDPHAEFIGGLGDRFVVVNRKNADWLFQAYANFIDAVKSDHPLQGRMYGHRSLDAVIKRSGLAPLPVYGAEYIIHRATLSVESLVRALEADVEQSPSGDVRERLSQALEAARAHRPSGSGDPH